MKTKTELLNKTSDVQYHNIESSDEEEEENEKDLALQHPDQLMKSFEDSQIQNIKLEKDLYCYAFVVIDRELIPDDE